MAPFYIAGVVVLYGVNAFSGALADSRSLNQSSSFGLWEPSERRDMLMVNLAAPEFRNDPRNLAGGKSGH